MTGSTDVQARAPLSQPVAQAPAQALVVQKPGLSWGQKLLGIGAIVTAGAGAGVITKVCVLYTLFVMFFCTLTLKERRIHSLK